ncbi:methionine ABC transporter ATP-binding protein [Saccharomonospora sp. CUA-673]|uniref:methionine ABC transporter permease n=1 Tax=Saccharomonospora sp. CUA-673 TaxID=1904969 RepID=UPI00095E93E6|nr:methionine ABC transporter permease [Saccharomonospora sp. CUA-673]OLT47026.1 methionine ABC transporter ATP-binding protein [Saccharomonospora sp. CUA-673]
MDTQLGELWPLLWQAVGETLYIVGVTIVLGGALGLALGMALYVTRRGGLYENRPVFFVLNLLVNFFRPIPFVIFIAAVQPAARVVVGTGIGTPAIIFALTLAAMFGISRIVEQNLVTVDPGVIEAARATGASRLRIIGTILIPEALGPLILGYAFAFVAIVDFSAQAGLIGAGGLGTFAQQYGYRQFDTVVTWTAVIIIVILVQLVQFLGNYASRRALRR